MDETLSASRVGREDVRARPVVSRGAHVRAAGLCASEHVRVARVCGREVRARYPRV